jgi:hypothetical protein
MITCEIDEQRVKDKCTEIFFLRIDTSTEIKLFMNVLFPGSISSGPFVYLF